MLSLWTPQPGHILQSDPSSVVNIEGERAFKQCFIPYTDTSTNPTENYWMDIYDMLYGIFFKSKVEHYDFLNQLDHISALNRDIQISVTKYKILCQVNSLFEILGNPSHKFEESFNHYAKRYSPSLHYRLLRIRLAIALFYDKSKILEESIEAYNNESKYWSSNFIRHYPEFQIETICSEFSNRELFMTQIKKNCEKSTIARLHCGQLTFSEHLDNWKNNKNDIINLRTVGETRARNQKFS
ncbi:MAG: hypothetical protein K2J27_05735 [Duncaniella sp.]|nr:hypothetical protein [Duncaniella sp.]